MPSDRARRESLKAIRDFGGEDALADLAADLEEDNGRLGRALARADSDHAKIAKERDAAIARAAAAEARCETIPIWRGIAEDIAEALSERELWAIQERARRMLAARRT